MITITIYRTKDIINGFIVEGHSGFAEEGSDIVCASVSILSYTAINSINLVAGVDPEFIIYDVDENIGLMSLRTLVNNDKTDVIYRNFMVGIELLLEDYSDYITLKFEEV
ncbi:MAG: ribosomal-processing cysteine protease Prp [Sedimentibacter sp.]|uniref:ribosomal-processing cysteine protease Prp n=1 Tax=Sedimentibacter sp. TaxID=1960295 RepID=UPI0029820EEE|nr:ribosomal-processing cysteine protease Prp [Sedimentibacter sp.]MDW5298620.1 ribosomal-processing cysteine protease Prp [Sedimentibacter sp.]